MKVVIDGKIYNTETAGKLASFSSHHNYSDFNYYEESLYQTKRGNYFIAGSGGPMSKYAQSCGSNNWSGGSGLYPITTKEAKKWLEVTENYDVLEYKFELEEA